VIIISRVILNLAFGNTRMSPSIKKEPNNIKWGWKVQATIVLEISNSKDIE
jgi:hypothetical protein